MNNFYHKQREEKRREVSLNSREWIMFWESLHLEISYILIISCIKLTNDLYFRKICQTNTGYDTMCMRSEYKFIKPLLVFNIKNF